MQEKTWWTQGQRREFMEGFSLWTAQGRDTFFQQHLARLVQAWGGRESVGWASLVCIAGDSNKALTIDKGVMLRSVHQIWVSKGIVFRHYGPQASGVQIQFNGSWICMLLLWWQFLHFGGLLFFPHSEIQRALCSEITPGGIWGASCNNGDQPTCIVSTLSLFYLWSLKLLKTKNYLETLGTICRNSGTYFLLYYEYQVVLLQGSVAILEEYCIAKK